MPAHWWGTVNSVVIGGIGAIAVTAIWSGLFPSLRAVNRLTEEELMMPEMEGSIAEPLN